MKIIIVCILCSFLLTGCTPGQRNAWANALAQYNSPQNQQLRMQRESVNIQREMLREQKNKNFHDQLFGINLNHY